MADGGWTAAGFLCDGLNAGPGRACCTVLAGCKRPDNGHIAGSKLSLGQQFGNQGPATTPEEYKPAVSLLSPGHESALGRCECYNKRDENPVIPTGGEAQCLCLPREPVPKGFETGASKGETRADRRQRVRTVSRK